jgi:hypothetical protein
MPTLLVDEVVAGVSMPKGAKHLLDIGAALTDSIPLPFAITILSFAPLARIWRHGLR